MSDKLYRLGASGAEPFYPQTTADRVLYGAGTLRDALDALTWHTLWSGDCQDFAAGVTLPEAALSSFLFALRLDVGATMAYAARQPNGDLLLRYLCPVTGDGGALTLYHGTLTLGAATLTLTGSGYATPQGGSSSAHERLLEVMVMATSRDALGLDEPLTLEELIAIAEGRAPGVSEAGGLTQSELAELLAGTASGAHEPNGLSNVEVEALLT